MLPLLCVLGGIVLAFATQAVDATSGYGLVPQFVPGPPSAVSTILSSIASAMVTPTSLVLTIMTVAVQLAMGQFSGRIVRAPLQDRPRVERDHDAALMPDDVLDWERRHGQVPQHRVLFALTGWGAAAATPRASSTPTGPGCSTRTG